MKALTLIAAMVGCAGACVAGLTACSETSAPTPVATTVLRAAQTGPYRKVLLRAVPAPGNSVESGTMVLYLRPVMKGEPIPELGD
jgi:hypothetical protein